MTHLWQQELPVKNKQIKIPINGEGECTTKHNRVQNAISSPNDQDQNVLSTFCLTFKIEFMLFWLSIYNLHWCPDVHQGVKENRLN